MSVLNIGIGSNCNEKMGMVLGCGYEFLGWEEIKKATFDEKF